MSFILELYISAFNSHLYIATSFLDFHGIMQIAVFFEMK